MSTAIFTCLRFALLGVAGFGLRHMFKHLSPRLSLILIAAFVTLVAAFQPLLLVPACIGFIVSQKLSHSTEVVDHEDDKLRQADENMLEQLQMAHFRYFQEYSHPTTGLTLDRSRTGAPSSVAATGFALTAFPVAAQRGWITRKEAADHALKVMRTLWNAPQGEDPTTTSGKFGFFFHFMHWDTATRFANCEISTIDTALLMSGVLFARQFYNGETAEEQEIRDLADKLYDRVEWTKALNAEGFVSHGWIPESGMIPHVWKGLDEGPILMLMGMGSKTHPLPADCWDKYFASARLETVHGQRHMVFGPLFGHQYCHCWVDFRGLKNEMVRRLGFDLFENSRRATLAQRAYGVANPGKWRGYSALDWGWTPGGGPAWEKRVVDGVEREFFEYIARGFPDAPDDGTIAPTAAASSLPFAPEVVMPTLWHWVRNRPEILGPQGFYDGFNMTYDGSTPSGWIDPETLGIDQGPIVLMLENHRSQFIWKTMKTSQPLQNALIRAGFTGDWLN